MHWNSEQYQTKFGFVANYGQAVVDLLKPQRGETILDLGCGTGELSHEIYSHGAQVLAVDISPDMIAAARQKYAAISHQPNNARPGNLIFELADATQLDRADGMVPAAHFDAVFSNAVLHWIKQPERVAQGVAQVLKPGGRFVFEMGGAGNIATMERAFAQALAEVAGVQYESPWFFARVSDYASVLEAAGMEVRMAVLFDRPTPLQGEHAIRDWFCMFTPDILYSLSAELQEQVFGQTEIRIRDTLFHHGQWQADYRRLRMVAVKC